MNKIPSIILCALLLGTNSLAGESIGISDCGAQCEKSLSDIGSYIESEVNSAETDVLIWSIDNEAVQSCLAEKVVNSGSWVEYGENWQEFRQHIESLVQERCIEPMLSHTNLTIIDIFLEKEGFRNPKGNRTYGLEAALVPKGSFLDQALIRIRVQKPNKSEHSE